MNRRTLILRTTFALAVLCLLAVCRTAVAADDVEIVRDIVYGHKDGMALTMDLLRPAEPNGAVVMFLQSGGWYSVYRDPAALVPASTPLLNKGITVLIVYHGSAPRFQVPDAVADVRRAVRYVHWKADELRVDPNRIGTLGGSAGGHLSLMLAATGDDGDAAAKEEILKHPSRISPRRWPSIRRPTSAIGRPIRRAAIAAVPALKPPLEFPAAKEAEVSPILFAGEKTAPALMIHGDKDPLVPIEHSRKMQAALAEMNATSELLTIEGAGHAFTPQQNDQRVLTGDGRLVREAPGEIANPPRHHRERRPGR
jgi:acetyl esterase/lipase